MVAAELAIATATDGEAAAARGGVSALGVGIARLVRGWIGRDASGREGCDAAVAGVLGCEVPDVACRLGSLDSIGLLGPDEAATDSKSLFEASLAAAMSSFPGGCRFSAVCDDFPDLPSLPILGESRIDLGTD